MFSLFYEKVEEKLPAVDCTSVITFKKITIGKLFLGHQQCPTKSENTSSLTSSESVNTGDL